MNQLIGYLSEGEQLKGSLTIPKQIGGGGGGGNLQDKTVNITPTESAQSQTVTADPGYDGLGEVGVNVGAISGSYVGSQVPRKSSSDLTASGATVTAPAGYYESAASKAVASGTEGTPTATKGSVSNHSVNVTPSVTNVAGYIAGGTKTGTAVTVSASELVSGVKTISANGTGIDVANFATADVAVPNSYAAGDEGKVVSNGALVSQTSDTVTANDTYDTTLINSLTVNVSGGGGGFQRKTGTIVLASDYAVSDESSTNLMIIDTGLSDLYGAIIYDKKWLDHTQTRSCFAGAVWVRGDDQSLYSNFPQRGGFGEIENANTSAWVAGNPNRQGGIVPHEARSSVPAGDFGFKVYSASYPARAGAELWWEAFGV